MYKTIVLDCQSVNAEINCGDCIAYRNCEMSKQKSVHSSADEALLLS